MTKCKVTWSLLIASLAAFGCDEAPQPKALPTFEDDAGTESSGDPVSADAGDAKPERRGPAYAVVSSDWSAVSVSLLGADGTLLADNYINSGSLPAGLVTALSGDVELPTSSGEQGVLVLIDRYKTDVITRIRLSDGKVLGQVKTHTPPSQATENAYTSNPQDYVRIDDETAWVTRNQPNLDPSVPDIDRGNDLLRINPTTMERTDERIDLSVLNTKGTRTNPDSGREEEVDVHAGPCRMARVGNTLIVGLARSAFDFSAYGTGMVAVVNLETKRVTGLEIEGLKGCTNVAPVPQSDDRVLVACAGIFAQESETAGVAIVRIADGAATIEQTWRAEDHADAPVLSRSFVPLSATLFAGASDGFSGDGASVFGTVDIETGEFSEVLSIPAGQGTFGTPLFDAESGLLLVPDSSANEDQSPTSGVHVLQQQGGGFRETKLVLVAQDTALPVRHVFPL
jgi:hypothetical protein